MMRAVGIDLGTTTISFAVTEGDGSVTEAKTVPNDSLIEGRQSWEHLQDMQRMVQRVLENLEALLKKYPDISAIGLTGQMHGILYVDGEGRALSPLYTWKDARGNRPFRGEESAAAWIQKNTYASAAPGYGLATHVYNCGYGLTPEGTASLCTAADYLGMALTGRRSPLVHVSNAAGMGFFDGKERRFLTEELRKAGADPSVLPEITDKVSPLGVYLGIPVYTAIGDNQASFLGAAGKKEGAVLVNLGTGGQISVLSDRFFSGKGIEARPFMKGNYLLVGASLCGGHAYAILERFFREYVRWATGEERPQYDVMEKIAAAGTGTEGMIVTTTFNGTRTDPQCGGRIQNMREDNFTPEGMVCGVLRGIVRELYDLYKIIEEGTGIHAEHLIASGNGLRKNKLLQEMFAEAFHADITLSENEEEAACGAATAASAEFCRSLASEPAGNCASEAAGPVGD